MTSKRKMRVFIAGAAGTLGLPLTRRLVEAGHHVIGLTRSAGKRSLIESTGAHAVIADALRREAVEGAVCASRPSHIVNLLTALPLGGALRSRDLQQTNRLRIEGSRNLLAAARCKCVRRVVAESFLAVYGFPAPGGKLDEETSLGPIEANHPLHETVMALRSLEQQHLDIRREGRLASVILRFGFLYGPGVSSTEAMIRNLTRGQMRLPTRMAGIGSWIHVDDAVSALALVLEDDAPSGVYNVSDNQPTTFGQAVAIAREAFGASRPRSVPMWLLRWLAPVVASMTTAHWALDNRKAQRELGWQPATPTLREGFASLTMRRARRIV